MFFDRATNEKCSFLLLLWHVAARIRQTLICILHSMGRRRRRRCHHHHTPSHVTRRSFHINFMRNTTQAHDVAWISSHLISGIGVRMCFERRFHL